MEIEKIHIRHCMLHYFHRHKTAAETVRVICETYGESSVSDDVCQYWFKRFKSGDIDLSYKSPSGRPQKVENDDLQALLDEDSAQTQRELSDKLGITQQAVSKRLYAMGKIQKEGKWVPHELTEDHCERRSSICLALLSRQRKKSFLWQIVTGDEKWVYYDNPKRKKHWVNSGQSISSTPQSNIHGKKLLLCIWWDEKGVLYYELLKPGQTITSESYCQQLNRLKKVLDEKRPACASKRRKVILLHDNARPHVAAIIKQTLLDLE